MHHAPEVRLEQPAMVFVRHFFQAAVDGDAGVVITAPLRATREAIRQVVLKRGQWILRKLAVPDREAAVRLIEDM